MRQASVSGWRKSSHSGPNSSCVEVGRTADGAAVRDTKNRAAGHLSLPAARWTAFITAIKQDRYDR